MVTQKTLAGARAGSEASPGRSSAGRRGTTAIRDDRDAARHLTSLTHRTLDARIRDSPFVNHKIWCRTHTEMAHARTSMG